MGRRSRKRQTPDWSTGMVEVRRSCQSQRRALELGSLLSDAGTSPLGMEGGIKDQG